MFRLPFLFAPSGRSSDTTATPRMRDETCRIDRRNFGYGIVDSPGRPVLLLHGWGLAHGSYARAAETLAARGYRVVLPDLPGFGSSSDLPVIGLSFRRYAGSMRSFLESCDDIAGEPVHVVGHSFGGAVAAQLACDAAHLVRSVTLVSALSGATWRRDGSVERLVAERPLWDWGVHLVRELPTSRFPQVTLEVLRDLSHNAVWHLPSLGVVALLARRSDLRCELAEVRSRQLPVAVVWPSRDRVVTRASIDDQCRALGIDGTVVEGNHAWPLTHPGSFGRTIGDIISSMETAARATDSPSPTADLSCPG
jgi:pimeloyl-ACP methyl ester carboxylesterase